MNKHDKRKIYLLNPQIEIHIRLFFRFRIGFGSTIDFHKALKTYFSRHSIRTCNRFCASFRASRAKRWNIETSKCFFFFFFFCSLRNCRVDVKSSNCGFVNAYDEKFSTDIGPRARLSGRDRTICYVRNTLVLCSPFGLPFVACFAFSIPVPNRPVEIEVFSLFFFCL